MKRPNYVNLTDCQTRYFLITNNLGNALVLVFVLQNILITDMSAHKEVHIGGSCYRWKLLSRGFLFFVVLLTMFQTLCILDQNFFITLAPVYYYFIAMYKYGCDITSLPQVSKQSHLILMHFLSLDFFPASILHWFFCL
jgi:hypothetical protein